MEGIEKIEKGIDADELLRRSDLCYGFAAMADGRTRQSKELKARGRAYLSAAFEANFGPLDLDISDDELLAELNG